MFKEENLSKTIIVVPILFIILTASIITFIHIKQADSKFKNDSKKLEKTFLNEEKERLVTILDSINSYVKYKKLTSLNILKDKVKDKIDFANTILTESYNNSIGIESSEAIQINILSSLSQLNSKDKGKYFLYGYSKNRNSFNSKNISLKDNINKDFHVQIDEVLHKKNTSFIFNKETVLRDKKLVELNKISYLKKFESLNLVLGYSEYLEDFEVDTKKEILKRLNLMKLQKNSFIFTLDDKLNVIQDTSNNFKNISYETIQTNKNMISSLFDYAKLSKIDLIEDEYKYFWNKIDKNNYTLDVFSYIDTWDWLIGININIKNIDKSIEGIIGINESKRNEIIEYSIKTALIFIFISSFLSYFISIKITNMLNQYKESIENQKSALRNINATLEVKVEEKTKELEVLNNKLKQKFDSEVQKNRHKDELLQVQSKMASMGEMIGNIAHQWRQPLSTISTIASGNCVKIDFDFINNNDMKNDFTKIVECTKHLSDTIEDFRNFFMENKKIEEFDLRELIDKNLILVGSTLQNNYIKVIQNFSSVKIYGVKNELLQATINIINNAKDILLLKDEKQRYIIIDIFQDEKNAYLIIKDSGGGIPKSIENKIFEPYFSTKDQSIGTGIGLHMTKEIINNSMKGEIFVSNEKFYIENKTHFGACFKLVFPLVFPSN
ncbi:sensor histidine kinase [Arcobacter peruensis]|uniref:sensor histidine kinase n=1 Tax=Arcobacter peruensis TaxID=2320140 RepID=UPI000F087E65|nr:cache domain-containing protein [Arcobacter peruensis]